MTHPAPLLTAGLLLAGLMAAGATRAHAETDPALAAAAAASKQALAAKHGAAENERVTRGVDQVLRYWRKDDGDAAAFSAFVEAEFIPKGQLLDDTFDRFEWALERLGGYAVSANRDMRMAADLEIGPILPLDRRLAGYDTGAHVTDDLFESKVAFVALLNFPLTTLDQRLKEGPQWSRRQWAEARLAQRFSVRVPADVNAKIAQAYADSAAYIAGYNVYMHHLVDDKGTRLFPAGMRLLSHWNLRDELKARYADPQGLAKQRLIQKVMEKIVTQDIPAVVVNNPLVDWNPATGAVTVSTVKDVTEIPPTAKAEAKNDREPDERYRQWMSIFEAEKLGDPYSPDNPTFIDRRFNVNREIPEAEVHKLFEDVLTSPLGPRVAKLIAQRLKRPLEPFDIWYAGFRPLSKFDAADLDAKTRAKYPNTAAYKADIPRLLRDLGFTEERAQMVAGNIVVDPARGSGHAMGAGRRDDQAHLRTRVGADGMDYKGYNIAVHEMGHNVEQTFSLNTIDHTLLQGVPNTAFTEALAFVFQARDLQLLGLGAPDAESQRLHALEDFWATREIAGVGLVDMAAWRWLYAHQGATPAQFREAVVAIAKETWNKYYAPIFGVKDVPILAVYSHMVDSGLYTPDYPLGHLIAFQVEQYFAKSGKPLGAEFERVTQLGSITPDQWMRQAVGAPLSAQPMLAAAEKAMAGPGSARKTAR